jgi:flagellar hook-basal body complex protein FliE
MGAINAITSLISSGLSGAAAPSSVQTTAGTAPAGNSFGDNVMSALDNLQSTQNNADSLAVKAATGDLTDVHNYTIAASEANLATEFTVALRNRAVDTFNEIMRMQI